MTTKAPRRAVWTPLAVYRAERAAFTLALLAAIAIVLPVLPHEECCDDDIRDQSGQ
jgi:hypothetical protein